MYNSTLNIAGFTDPSQQKSSFTNLTGSLGDAFAASTPAPVFDDPQAIARAEDWIYTDCLTAAGADRFPTAVAIGIVVRNDFKLSLHASQYLVECWNAFACMPRLTPSEITQATEIAYFQPELAERIARGEGHAESKEQPAPEPSPTGRESTAPSGDVSPPRAIAATTAPSSLTAAALVDTTTPNLAVNTPPECALCAARRTAKRERTRRWRARMRNVTQPARNAMEVANG